MKIFIQGELSTNKMHGIWMVQRLKAYKTEFELKWDTGKLRGCCPHRQTFKWGNDSLLSIYHVEKAAVWKTE